jgi:F-type H+-transporting ATPase subunit alpha
MSKYSTRGNSSYGLITSVGSGVLNLEGFLSSSVGEVFEVSSSADQGIVVNISRDSSLNLGVGALLIGNNTRISEGSIVKSLSSLATLAIGDFLLGSLIDPQGGCMLNSTRVDAQYRWVIEAPSPGIVERESVFEPLATGLISIDSMVPIGRGQRELVVGDRQTGKTSLGIDTILNQNSSGVLSLYLPIGQKSAAILEVFISLVRRDSLANLSIVVASAGSSSLFQFLCAYTGSSLAEFFMLVRATACFIIFDDLSRHAVAYREIYLLLRRPPGREAYPGEIFFVHSRLLERSSKLNNSLGGGSLTSFPVIETLAGDVSAYITTNVISITDGQIFLSIDLFLSGIKPSIDVGLSVTRVGSAAQWSGMRMVSGSYKLELAQFVELEAFSQFSSDLGSDTKDRLARGRVLVELLKQTCGSPMNLKDEVSLLSIANQGIPAELLSIGEIPQFLTLYNGLPCWLAILVCPRLVARAVAGMGTSLA